MPSTATARTESPATRTPSSPPAESSRSRSLEARAPLGVLRLAIAGGGTGGHLVPGMNVCLHALSGRRSQVGAAGLSDVLWLSSGRSVEEPVLAGFAEKLAGITFEKVVLALEPRGGGAPSRTALLLRTAPAVMRARGALAEHETQVLLGLGGFTCLPAVIAARSLGIPVALLEMNAATGSATRWLAPFARLVLHAWPGSLSPGSSTREAAGAKSIESTHRHVGPPLAPDFDGREISSAEQAGARAEFGLDPDRELLLVLGGSQGATALNRFVQSHAPALVAGGLQILHQTGPGKLDEACESFTGYRAVEYLAPMHRALSAATLVLTRGGASTLAEIAAIGRPALVVPYPHHADRHQERNAAELGLGVRVVAEDRLNLSLRTEIERLCSREAFEERSTMTRTLRTALPSNGAEKILAALAALAESKSVTPAISEGGLRS